MEQTLVFSGNICSDLQSRLADTDYDRLFILTDETTHRLCLPRLEGCAALADATPIVIGATDASKTLDTLAAVWKALGDGGASRHSLLVCLGGGMVTDLGGFAAATFKRGIRFLNIPTTLLSMVDAAVGGKTGINFNGLKNEVGAFCEADAVLIDTGFLRTLDMENILSGYAEMLKHALLHDSDMWAGHLAYEPCDRDFGRLQEMVAESIGVKSRVVAEDPHEKGIRKALNLGHTVGHAFESFALLRQRPVLHGYAVAWGLLCELYLSCRLVGFPTEKMRQTAAFVRDHYGTFDFSCDGYETLYALMLHDKKNVGGHINFTLLSDVGQVRLDCRAEKAVLFEMFDFFREGA